MDTAIGNPPPAPPTGYPVPRSQKSYKLCCGFCCIVGTGLLGLGVFALTINLIWRTDDPDFRLNSLSLSGLNVSSDTVSGNWTASFTFVNPNKKAIISYTKLHAEISYRDLELAVACHLRSFVQETNSATDITAAFHPTLQYLDGPLLNRIVDDRSRGRVKFNVELEATAKLEVRRKSFTKITHHYRVFCPVEISSNSAAGELIGRPRSCSISKCKKWDPVHSVTFW